MKTYQPQPTLSLQVNFVYTHQSTVAGALPVLNHRTQLDVSKSVKNMRSVHDPGSDDQNTCMARCLVLGSFLAQRTAAGYASWAAVCRSTDRRVFKSLRRWKILTGSNGRDRPNAALRDEVVQLYKKARIPLGAPLELERLDDFCDVLDGGPYRVVVYETDRTRPIYVCGSQAPDALPIYLLYIEGHLVLVTSVKLLFRARNFCAACDKAYGGSKM